MLAKILLRLKPNFARSLRPKKPVPISNHHQQPIDPGLFQPDQTQPQFNTKLKNQDKKLKEKVEKMVDSNLKQEEILKLFFPQTNKPTQTQQQLDLARQEMILDQILKKNSKKKELPIGSKYEDLPVPDTQKQQKRSRIIAKLRENSGKGNQIIEMSFQDQLKQKYSQDLLQKAKEQKSKQMKYFNNLMSNNYIKEEHEGTPNILERRLAKDESYAGIRERDKAKRQKANEERKERNQMINFYQKLELEYKKEKMPNSQELVEYEDENYYKEKGIKQFEMRQAKNLDKELKEAGEKDMNESANMHTILMDEYEDIKYEMDDKKELYETSSFGKIDAKMRELEKRLKKQGVMLELEDLKAMKKDLLFSQKKDRQQQLEYQKYLLKKQKKNEAKEYFKKIHKERLREDLDYENDYKSRFKDFKYDPLNVEENMEKMKQAELERKSVFVNKDVKSEIHFKKTELNMGDFVVSCFYQNLLTPNQNMSQKIEITSLRYNQKKTVVNVFWKFLNVSLENDEREKSKMQSRLKQRAGFMSGKMTQILGLRYGPDIRFHYDTILNQTKEIKEELEKTKQQVIQYELKTLMEKGHLKTQEQVNQTREKLKVVAEENIRNFHNREKLLSKKYIKAQKAKSTASPKKKPAEQRFWEHIDKL